MITCSLSPIASEFWTASDETYHRSSSDEQIKPPLHLILSNLPCHCTGFSLVTSASTIEVHTAGAGGQLQEPSYCTTSRGVQQDDGLKLHRVIVAEDSLESIHLKLLSLPKPGTSCVIRSISPLIKGTDEAGGSSSQGQMDEVRKILHSAVSSDPSSSLQVLAREIARKALLVQEAAAVEQQGGPRGEGKSYPKEAPQQATTDASRRLEDAISRVEALEEKMTRKIEQLDRMISLVTNLVVQSNLPLGQLNAAPS